MGYSESLEAAGAKVLAYETFGDYQGSWAAIVEYEGQKGVAFGSYGSCSGCDAFEAEFDYEDEPEEREGKYYKRWDEEILKQEYDQLLSNYQKRLGDFGRSYLTNLGTKETIQTNLDKMSDENWYDEDDRSMYKWCLEKLQTI